MPDGTYPRPELRREAADLTRRIFELLQNHMPLFRPGAANPGVWHLEGVGLAHEATVAALDLFSEFAYARLGEIDGAPLRQGGPATGYSTWSFNVDTAFTIRRGTPVRLITADREVEMTVVDDVVKPSGETATAEGEVELVTLETGVALNDLSGTLVLDEPIPEIDGGGLALVGITFGGSDAEDVQVYLDRLTRRRRLQTPRTVKADEFAVFVLEEPDVGRVTVKDLYNPETASTTARATSCIFVATPEGEPLLDGRVEQIEAELRDSVEVNFDAFVRDHTYVTVNVSGTAKSLPGYDPAVVKARLEAAALAHLFPGTFGVPDQGDLAFAAVPASKVYYLDLSGDVKNAGKGVAHLTGLTIAKAGDTLAASDVTLTGVAPLPKPGTIDFTVTPL